MMKSSKRDTAQSPPDLISDRNVKQFSMALLLELPRMRTTRSSPSRARPSS